MTTRRPCPPAPGPLEDYAVHFDPLFHALAQRHSFRTYLARLLVPRDRHKTLTALAGAEPLVQAQAAPVQQLQFFLSESTWAADAITARTLQLLGADPLTTTTADGVLVIDDTGERKDGCATDHVARQYLGSVGKIDNGIVAVTTLKAHELRHYPLHVMPYTLECRLVGCKQAPAFQTKPQISLSLVERAQAAGITLKAIVADCFYGDNNALEAALRQRRLLCAGAPRHGRARLGTCRRRPFVRGCRARVAAARLAKDRAPLSRRPCRTLVGGRADAVRLWPRQDGARGLRHDRSPYVAGSVDLVFDDQHVC